MNEYNDNYDEMVIRYDCRDHYRHTGEHNAPKDYNRAELSVWNDEVKQIQRDEAQSA